ncbi:MAG: AIR synthase related protein, partial [Nanoarchaeota archaeon]
MSLSNEATKEKILSLIAKTQNGNEPPGTSDGIGNKGYYHWKHRTFRNAVIDALAMTLNDAAVKKFQAKYLQNHIMVPKENEEVILEIVSCLVEECKKREIAIIGGETSIHEYSQELEISI